MNPTVAVVAQGAMGAGVGGRLAERGLRVVTSLAGRSEDSAKRAKAAGMVAVSDQELARADYFLSILPPSDALALAEKMAALIGAEQSQADLCRLQRGEPADQDRDRPRHHPGGFAVRRCRHRRRPAEGGLRRAGHLCVRS